MYFFYLKIHTNIAMIYDFSGLKKEVLLRVSYLTNGVGL